MMLAIRKPSLRAVKLIPSLRKKNACKARVAGDWHKELRTWCAEDLRPRSPEGIAESVPCMGGDCRARFAMLMALEGIMAQVLIYNRAVNWRQHGAPHSTRHHQHAVVLAAIKAEPDGGR